MNRMNKYHQLSVLISGSVILLLLSIMWIRAAFRQEYQVIQNKANEYRTEPDGLLAEASGIIELRPVLLDRTDRCQTCHFKIIGAPDSLLPLPFSSHPGTYLSDHPADDFGCTICHGGQGLATTSSDAHAKDYGSKWPFPLLDQPFIQSSCGQCHLTIFSSPEPMAEAQAFFRGYELFTTEGCLGCHKARGLGGNIGPDLTAQGEKTRYEYNFGHIDGEQTVPNWLKEHFRDPEMVSPGSRMLSIDLPEEDFDALATFTMGLYKPDIHYSLFSQATLDELTGHRPEIAGGSLYPMLCAGCHGKSAEGKDYTTFRTGVPSIGNRDFLRMADEDFLAFNIYYGRGYKEMPSWQPSRSGLSEKEIMSLTHGLLGRKSTPSSWEEVKNVRPDAGKGNELFDQHCVVCHGRPDSAGVIRSVEQPSFLRAVDDHTIYRLLMNGRSSSGMPSFFHLTSAEAAHLIGHLRQLGRYEPVRLSDLPEGDPGAGEFPFHYRCSRCHGEYGEGNTGPAIINKAFLASVDDAFLLRNISLGREHTAMFGWETAMVGADRPDRQEIANIIAFMRETAKYGAPYIFPGPVHGDPTRGEGLFKKHCSECHGKSGEGITAPALNNQEFLNGATNGYIFGTLTLGREGTRMPNWSLGTPEQPALSGNEKMDVVAFVRQWQRVQIKRPVLTDQNASFTPK